MDFSKKVLLWLVTPALGIAEPWKKHVIYEGARANVAVAADFTGDGKLDVISNSGQQTRLFVAPDWKEHIIDDTAGHNFIHGEVMDVDNDGDPDFIGARYRPGLVAWFETPKNPTVGKWKMRIADDTLNGIHGVLGVMSMEMGATTY